MLSTTLIWAVIPFSPIHVGVDLSIGLLYFVAIGSIGTLSVIMAGWASNNKYALLGSFRAVAALVSYEVPMVIALLVPVLLAGSMGMQDIVRAQLGMWFIVPALVSAIIFYISNLAETGRAPFDLIEAESELVAGYNIEYSGMKFGLFMANEFMHAFTANLLFTVHFPRRLVGSVRRAGAVPRLRLADGQDLHRLYSVADPARDHSARPHRPDDELQLEVPRADLDCRTCWSSRFCCKSPRRSVWARRPASTDFLAQLAASARAAGRQSRADGGCGDRFCATPDGRSAWRDAARAAQQEEERAVVAASISATRTLGEMLHA